MKYLKNFKESKDEYYIEIGKIVNNCEPAFLPSTKIDISKQSVAYINDIFKGTVSQIDIDYNRSSSYNEIGLIETEVGNKYIRISKNSDITISEYTDEYYKVNVFRDGLSYKCDQLDGVRELLKDKGLIK